MPPRSQIDSLPSDDRAVIEEVLIKYNFQNYRGMVEELAERGFEIKRSTLNRWGQEFEQRCNLLRTVTQQAEAIVKASPDEKNAINDALIRLVQEKVFNLLLELEKSEEVLDFKSIATLSRSVHNLAKASVQQKKWQQEVQERAQAAADEVGQMARQAGLGDDAVNLIMNRVLGIATGG